MVKKRKDKGKRGLLQRPSTNLKVNLFNGIKNRLRKLKSVAKKKTVIYGAAAATLIGSAEYARHNIPFWVGPEKRVNIEMGFTAHRKKEHAKPIINKIEMAKLEGNPYHVFFIENALQSESRFKTNVLAMNEDLRRIREEYKSRRNLGENHHSTLSAIHVKYKRTFPSNSEYQEEVDIGLALNGVRVVPIERYSQEELVYIQRLQNVSERYSDEYTRAIRDFKPLVELQRIELVSSETDYQIGLFRDERIIQRLPQIVKEVKKIFPELNKEKQLKTIGSLGTAHRGVYLKFNGEISGILLDEITSNRINYSLSQYATIRAAGVRNVRQAEIRLFVLSSYFDPQINVLLRAGREDLLKKAFQNAVKMSQAEFEKLSRDTENIKNDRERVTFIMGRLSGQN